MLGLLRFLNAVMALTVGWCSVVMSLVILVWLLWDFLQGPIIGKLSIPVPPEMLHFLFAPAWLGIAALGFFIVVYLLKPLRLVMRHVFAEVQYERVEKNSPLYRSVQQLATGMGQRTPKVYIYNSNIPNAFTLSSLFSDAVAVSIGLIQSLERDEIEWVLAHELAHIKHIDCIAASFWVASVQSMGFAWMIHHWIMRMVVDSVELLRLSLFFIALLLWPLLLINYSVLLIFRVAKGCFYLLDLHIARAMEYRADHLAALSQGANPGIRALQKLSSGVEPSLGGLLSTHPVDERRLRRLQKLAKTQQEAADQSIGKQAAV